MTKLIDPGELVHKMRFDSKSIENQLKAKGYLLDDGIIKELVERKEAIEVLKEAKYFYSEEYEELLFKFEMDVLCRCNEYYNQNS